MGRAHRNEVAASYFRSAKRIAEKIGDSKAIAKALIGLGNVRDGKEKEHYRAALDIALEMEIVPLKLRPSLDWAMLTVLKEITQLRINTFLT